MGTLYYNSRFLYLCNPDTRTLVSNNHNGAIKNYTQKNI
jgi:hypothetical protein